MLSSKWNVIPFPFLILCYNNFGVIALKWSFSFRDFPFWTLWGSPFNQGLKLLWQSFMRLVTTNMFHEQKLAHSVCFSSCKGWKVSREACILIIRASGSLRGCPVLVTWRDSQGKHTLNKCWDMVMCFCFVFKRLSACAVLAAEKMVWICDGFRLTLNGLISARNTPLVEIGFLIYVVLIFHCLIIIGKISWWWWLLCGGKPTTYW